MVEYHDTLEFDVDKPILVMGKLCKNYQLGLTQLCVLREIDLIIHSGEYVAIMGPSGSGKLTLLNMIGCLDRPSGGDYILGGQSVAQLDDDELSSIRGADILAILDRLHNEGKTLIVVTHDEHIAAKAERVIQLFDGRSQEESKCPDRLQKEKS